jgi:cytochrome c biogenesis protein CcmG/thiol:disulfide interchange protein DsbE
MLGALVAIAASAASCSGSEPPRASAPSPLLGKPLKDFRRTTLAGETLDTTALRGRVVVIEFFAKYCKPCEKMLPETASLSRELGDVAFIGISEDEHASEADAMVKRHGLPFPVVHDSGNVIAGRFRVSEMPATFVIDRNGKVSWVGGTDHSSRDLREAILAAGR